MLLNLLRRYSITLNLLGLVLLMACNHVEPQKETEAAVINDQSKQTCVQTIIAKDDSLGTSRNHTCETMPLSTAIGQYVQGLKGLDFKNCPENFTRAFKDHREAWAAMQKFTDKYPDLRGEMHDLFDQLESGQDSGAFKTRLKAIWDTWAEVEGAMNIVENN